MRKFFVISLLTFLFVNAGLSTPIGYTWILEYQIQNSLMYPGPPYDNDVKVVIGSPDCEAMDECTLEIVVFEVNSSTQAFRELEAQDYSYGTATYDFHVSLDTGYDTYCAKIRVKSGYSCAYQFNDDPHCPSPPYGFEVQINIDACDY